jgi:hypothetical protein
MSDAVIPDVPEAVELAAVRSLQPNEPGGTLVVDSFAEAQSVIRTVLAAAFSVVDTDTGLPSVLVPWLTPLGRVDRAGGGELHVWVFRELDRYPELGTPVYRVIDRSATR